MPNLNFTKSKPQWRLASLYANEHIQQTSPIILMSMILPNLPALSLQDKVRKHVLKTAFILLFSKHKKTSSRLFSTLHTDSSHYTLSLRQVFQYQKTCLRKPKKFMTCRVLSPDSSSQKYHAAKSRKKAMAPTFSALSIRNLQKQINSKSLESTKSRRVSKCQKSISPSQSSDSRRS